MNRFSPIYNLDEIVTELKNLTTKLTDLQETSNFYAMRFRETKKAMALTVARAVSLLKTHAKETGNTEF